MTLRRRRGGEESATADAALAAPPDGAGRVGGSCGGYRLVRLLATGWRASVYLGHADGGTAGGGGSSVAVKVFHASVPLDSIDTEIEALAAGAHEHTVRLLDVASDPDGRPCLVLERLAGGSLSRLVAERGEIEPGEAVTILVPLVDAVHALHAAGVVHGGLRLSSVLFRGSGAPVLAGFGRAALAAAGRPEAALAADLGVGRDWDDLRTLADAVLARVPGERTAVLSAEGALDAERLFALAEPSPVQLELPRGGELVPPARLAVQPAVARIAAGHRADGAAWGSAVRALGWLRGRAAEVRPRFWLLAGAVGASICAALVFVPPSETPSPPPTGAAATPPPAPETTAPTVAPRVEEDALTALPTLLAERERCLRELSIQCLDGVLQRGSAAMERDTSLIRSIQDGGEVPLDAAIAAGEPALVEQLGDTAIVDLRPPGNSEPASLLMMRSEAGWRIRSYLP